MDNKIIEIAKKYAAKVKQQMPAQMIVLYGSRVRGKAGIASDIDIAVVVDEAPANYLRTSANLFNMVRDIDKRIEPVLVVRKNDKGGFLDSVLKHGSIIYKAGL